MPSPSGACALRRIVRALLRQFYLADEVVVDIDVLPAGAVFIVIALVDDDLFDNFSQKCVDEFFKAHILVNDLQKTVCVGRGLLCFGKLRFQRGSAVFELLLLRLIVGGKLCKPFIRDPSGYAVLIQPLEDGGQLRDPLFGGVQILTPCGVLLFAAVLVLLDQELAEPGLVLCGVAGDLADVLGHAFGQMVGADKVRCTVRCPLLVAAADIAVLLPLVRLIPLLVKHAAAVSAEQQAREQADFPVAVGAYKQGLGKALPNKIPAGENKRKANFGTVVESCSKKVAASGVLYLLLQFPAGRSGCLLLYQCHKREICQLCGQHF